MSHAPSAAFSLVRRGYDPGEVDRRVVALVAQLEEANRHTETLSTRVHDLERQCAELQQTPSGGPAYAGLGRRIEQMLTLAEQEAEQVRRSAHEDAQNARERAEAEAAQVRAAADRHADERRSEAAAEATRLLEEARRAADQLRDEAERDTRTRHEEAEALFERNRAKAAQAAADFETTLSHRRDQAQRDFTQQMNANQQRVSALEERAEDVRNETEKQRAEADRRSTQLIEEAQRRADDLVAQARAQADRMRADSDRELAAATQRRDSINSQLSNVRQMLATLTGATLPNPLGDDRQPDDRQPDNGQPDNGQRDDAAGTPGTAAPDVIDVRDVREDDRHSDATAAPAVAVPSQSDSHDAHKLPSGGSTG